MWISAFAAAARSGADRSAVARIANILGDSRDRIAQWARSQRDRCDRVAIVTDNVLWQMVLRTSSLASKQRMRGFTDIEDAFDWLSGR